MTELRTITCDHEGAVLEGQMAVPIGSRRSAEAAGTA